MNSPNSFSFDDLVFFHEVNSVSPSSYLDDYYIDLERVSSDITPFDFTLPLSPWPEAIQSLYSQLLSSTPLNILYHSFLLGKMIHQHELQLLGRLPLTPLRSRKIGRRLHIAFSQAVKNAGNHSTNRYRAARRVFALYSIREEQALASAMVITPESLRRMPKQDFQRLYNHAKSLGNGITNFPHHLSVFIGTTEP